MLERTVSVAVPYSSVPHMKSVGYPRALQNLEKTSAERTLPMMLPKRFVVYIGQGTRNQDIPLPFLGKNLFSVCERHVGLNWWDAEGDAEGPAEGLILCVG